MKLVVAWGGPVVGVIVPLIVWGIAAALRWRAAFVLRFFAGFCLIGNGAYLACGSFGRVGDCGQLLPHGAALGQLWLFGAIAVPMGLWLWHGQGAQFGLGSAAQQTNPGIAYGSLIGFGLLLALALIVGGN